MEATEYSALQHDFPSSIFYLQNFVELRTTHTKSYLALMIPPCSVLS